MPENHRKKLFFSVIVQGMVPNSGTRDKRKDDYTTRLLTKIFPKGTYYVCVKSYRELGNNKRVYEAWPNTVKAVVKEADGQKRECRSAPFSIMPEEKRCQGLARKTNQLTQKWCIAIVKERSDDGCHPGNLEREQNSYG